tara:strand:+ start:2588 stop:3403 length:816 start_codon:yes stop_codon:yes gene_type:complete
MKAKHNKKRNTAFIFEALSQEMTKAIVSKDDTRKRNVVSIVKSHFKKGTELRKELELYQSLSEHSELDKDTATRMVQEAKRIHSTVDSEKLFVEQTALINSINKTLSKSVFSNFVGNYKYLATISQMFNNDAKVKERILMENTIVDAMTKDAENQEMKPVDGIVYKSFVKNFNESYAPVLPDAQKELLGKYISSVSDNGLEFKVYMNSEVGRLKEAVKKSLETKEITEDAEMKESTTQVYQMLEEMAKKPIDEELIQQVMNIQNFIVEVES